MIGAAKSHGGPAVADVWVVLCTCPDGTTAHHLAAGLAEARLAACVNVLPEIRSIYRWQGETCDEAEVLMIAKTTAQAYPQLERWLQAQHPYEVPEVLALPAAAGSHAYRQWVARETAAP